MNLPANKVEVDEDIAIKNHPNAAIGEHTMIIFFVPIHPEMIPPNGVKIVKQKHSKEANQDCLVVFKPRCGNSTVVNPHKMLKEFTTRHTDNVAKNLKLLFENETHFQKIVLLT